MKTIEEINAITAKINLLALPYAAEIHESAHDFLFKDGYVRQERKEVAEALVELLDSAYEKDCFEVFGREIEEWVVSPRLLDEEGEPLFNLPPVVRSLIFCVSDLDVDHNWFYARWSLEQA